jgi:hypothetical protein
MSSTNNAIGGSIRSKILLISSGGWNRTCVLRIITLNEGTQRPTTEPGPPDQNPEQYIKNSDPNLYKPYNTFSLQMYKVIVKF